MFRLIDEQKDFFVFYKKAGENFHTENEDLGFFQQLKEKYGEIFPVHRLDKVTSGLLLVAKNVEACRKLNKLFLNHQIQKYYLAISDRKPQKKQGWIIGDMEKSRRGTWKLKLTKNCPAITYFFSKSLGEGRRIYLLKPSSGKTHQLRVAMKSLGAPICGDPLYYPGNDKKKEKRCYLHAYALCFELEGQRFLYNNPPKEEGLFELKSFKEVVVNEYLSPEKLIWPTRKKLNE